MKKVLLIIVLMFSLVTVYAKENKLYFYEKDDRLYFESSLLDQDVFMKHEDMVPGSKYTDTLKIENGTETPYNLYFKIVPPNQTQQAQELLEYIEMKITLDGKLIYDGRATGLDYTNSGVNLQKAVLLGEFKPSKESVMVVNTHLKEEYSNTLNRDSSHIDWSFYVQYGDEEEPTEIIEVPDTNANRSNFVTIVSVTIIAFGMFIMIISLLNKKKKNRR